MIIPRQIDTGSGITLEYQGRLLYSRVDPKSRPLRIARETELKPETLYIIPSPLLLYGIDELINRLPDGSFLLLLEKEKPLEELTREALTRFNIKNASFSFVAYKDPEEIIGYLNDQSLWPFRRVEQLVLSGGYGLHREYYTRVFRTLEETARIAYQDKLTQVYFARRWMKNFFANLLNYESPLPYTMLQSDRPVVVAGAGESLENSLEQIISTRDKIFLLAVDTALPFLAAHNQVPDAVVVLESQFINLRDFYGIPTKEIILIADLFSFPRVWRLSWKKKLAFFSRFSPLRFFEILQKHALEEYTLPPYGSVGVAAVAIASSISRTAVYCSGIDFSYRLGKSHARGTQFLFGELCSSSRVLPAGSFVPFFRRPLLQTKGKTSQVLTDLILLNYRTALKIFTSTADNIYDLNPEGLFIGAEYADKIEISDILPNTPVYKESFFRKSSFSWKYFLQQEYEILSRIYNLGHAYLQGKTVDTDFFSLVEQRDYLTAHFPEQLRNLPRNTEFTKRLLIALEGYRIYLGRLLGDSR
ncbi:6-hydroxymethylpterin diphosphokinase MptE-like protein [Marispirochaeta sp.]|uniref:6-hydroxymethylpterin diphosphokinase MptE-like protein n=1 Tax=Marispirochaeta sp. TaxID=2038653 RepID=UPI0029C93E5F|nr:6-hydroxymethylpterin diphosphokinase MptE-like protein [Marispirochaeta sp.]